MYIHICVCVRVCMGVCVRVCIEGVESRQDISRISVHVISFHVPIKRNILRLQSIQIEIVLILNIF